MKHIMMMLAMVLLYLPNVVYGMDTNEWINVRTYDQAPYKISRGDVMYCGTLQKMLDNSEFQNSESIALLDPSMTFANLKILFNYFHSQKDYKRALALIDFPGVIGLMNAAHYLDCALVLENLVKYYIAKIQLCSDDKWKMSYRSLMPELDVIVAKKLIQHSAFFGTVLKRKKIFPNKSIDIKRGEGEHIDSFFCEDNYLLTTDKNGCARVWDIRKETCIKEFKGSADYDTMRFFAWGPHGILAIGPNNSSSNNCIEIWDLKNDVCLKKIYGLFHDSALSDDGSLLAALAYENIYIWDLAKDELIATLDTFPNRTVRQKIERRYDSNPGCCGFCPKSKNLLYICERMPYRINIWNAVTGHRSFVEIAKKITEPSIYDFLCTPCGKRLIICSSEQEGDEKTISIVNLKTKAIQNNVICDQDHVRSASVVHGFSPDGRHCLVRTGRNMSVLNVKTNTIIDAFELVKNIASHENISFFFKKNQPCPHSYRVHTSDYSRKYNRNGDFKGSYDLLFPDTVMIEVSDNKLYIAKENEHQLYLYGPLINDKKIKRKLENLTTEQLVFLTNLIKQPQVPAIINYEGPFGLIRDPFYSLFNSLPHAIKKIMQKYVHIDSKKCIQGLKSSCHYSSMSDGIRHIFAQYGVKENPEMSVNKKKQPWYIKARNQNPNTFKKPKDLPSPFKPFNKTLTFTGFVAGIALGYKLADYYKVRDNLVGPLMGICGGIGILAAQIQ